MINLGVDIDTRTRERRNLLIFHFCYWLLAIVRNTYLVNFEIF